MGPTARKESRFSPFRRLRFSTTMDDKTEFEIEVKTHDGDIELRTQGGN